MNAWEEEKEHFNREEVDIIFIAEGGSPDIVTVFIDKGNTISFPIFFDTQKDYIKLNQLDEFPEKKCVLINEKDEIILVGSPFETQELLGKYIQTVKALGKNKNANS